MGAALLLKVTELACQRGGQIVFAGVSFAVAAGEALQVTGANGAGKSSLLRLLAGLGRPAAGQIVCPELRSYLGHDSALKPLLSVRANLAYWRALDGSAAPAPASVLPLGADALMDRPVRYLSQGQQRRVALARALDPARPVWLLDEPSAGLDAAACAELAQLMTAHCARGGAVVAATHVELGLDSAASLELRA